MPVQPPHREYTNAERVFRWLWEEICILYHDDKLERAHELALELYQYAELPLGIRGPCCTLLATGDGDYVAFAHEAVECCERILAVDPDNTSSQALLAEARDALECAEADAKKEPDEVDGDDDFPPASPTDGDMSRESPGLLGVNDGTSGESGAGEQHVTDPAQSEETTPKAVSKVGGD